MSLTAEPVFGGLQSREFAQLEELANRDPRSLSEEELAELEGLARWGLYMDDEVGLPEFCGAGLCACDGPCTNERADLSDEQREWFYTIRKAALDEMYRRRDPSWELFDHAPAARVLVAQAVSRATEVARRHQPRTRPREHRPRRRSRARSPARSTDDDPEPAGRALARPDVVPAGALT